MANPGGISNDDAIVLEFTDDSTTTNRQVWHVLPTFFVMLAGVSNSIMDTLDFHFSESTFSHYDANFWDPQVSWRNKYKNDDVSH